MKRIGLRGVSLSAVRPRRVGVGLDEGVRTVVEQINLLWDDGSCMLWDDGSKVIAGQKRVVPTENKYLCFDNGDAMLWDNGDTVVAGLRRLP